MANRYDIVATNSDFCAIPLYWNDQGAILPDAKDKDYLEKINILCRDVDADFIIPGSENELSVLCRNKSKIEQNGCILLANPPDVVEIGEDKIETDRFLCNNGIGSPKTFPGIDFHIADSIGWPLIVKPRRGHGSQNVFIVRSREHLAVIAKQFSLLKEDPIMQEYIGDASVEYTASALTNMSGEIIGSIATKRALMGGATQMVEVQKYPEICEAAEKTAKAIGARGPINIQCRLHKEKVIIFEINPRFSGSAPFRAMAGFNEPDLLIRSIIEGHTIKDFKIKYGQIGIRGFTEVLFEEKRIDLLNRY
jgi:carbamoyl-phosphate synthase large subunit